MTNLKNILEKHINNYDTYVSKSSKNEANKLTASIVIPVFNSESTLPFCIESIIKQKSKENIKEVIVINDGSEDESLSIVKKLASKYKNNLNIIIKNNLKRKYASYCRNMGIKISTADLILFIDSDIILPPTYVKEHLSIHQNIEDCIVFSLRSDIKHDELSKINFPVKDFKNEFRHKILQKNKFLKNSNFTIDNQFTLAELCLTCAISYKRKDLTLVKGCPENFVGWGFNDTAMAAKVIALGRKVIPAINASVYHIHHKPRSGSNFIKNNEYEINRKRYEKMISMPYLNTFKYKIKELEI